MTIPQPGFSRHKESSLMLDFGSSHKFSRVTLYWETAYAKSYAIQVSQNGLDWTTIYSTTEGDGGLDDITFPVATGRYIRMYGTERATEWGYSLYEMIVDQRGKHHCQSGRGEKQKADFRR